MCDQCVFRCVVRYVVRCVVSRFVGCLTWDVPTNYSQVAILGSRYKSVDFGAGMGPSVPHGGLRTFHQKSTCLMQLTLWPRCVVRCVVCGLVCGQVDQVCAGVPRSYETAPSPRAYRALGIVLLWDPRGVQFLMSEVPLWSASFRMTDRFFLFPRKAGRRFSS